MKISTQPVTCHGGVAKRQKRRSVRAIFTCLLAGATISLIGTSDARAAEIQPTNGHWVAVMKFRSVSGCSAQMRHDIESDAEDEELYSKVLEFPNPLDLNKLNKLWEVDINWVRNGPNRWAGTMFETERTLLGKITSDTAIDTQVVSREKIDQQMVMTVSFPPRMARQIGSSDPCVIHFDVQHRLR